MLIYIYIYVCMYEYTHVFFVAILGSSAASSAYQARPILLRTLSRRLLSACSAHRPRQI